MNRNQHNNCLTTAVYFRNSIIKQAPRKDKSNEQLLKQIFIMYGQKLGGWNEMKSTAAQNSLMSAYYPVRYDRN